MKKMISILLCMIFCFACFAPAAFAADKKTIKVATNVAFPPYEYYEDEKAVGIDVDIMQAICDKLGYEMELSDMEFGSIITAVASGKIDVGFGAITITEERAKSVHFTTSTGDIYATGDFGEDHIARFNKGADAVQALLTGKCDAVIIDNSPAETFVSQNKGLKILPTVYAEEEYGFELSYDNEELYNEVNGALEELLKDGTVQKIVDKYISAD